MTPKCPIIEEQWKLIDLEGVVPDYYFISNLGRLKNIKGQFIKPDKINNGYYVYRLYTGAVPKYKHMLAHRLVKIYFDPIDNPELYTVNHEDLDKSNNEEWNLTWMDQHDNNIHKVVNLHQYGTQFYNSKLNNDQLKIIIDMLQKNYSYSDIVVSIGLEDTVNNRETIGNIKRGKTYKREIKNILMDRFND